MMIIVEFAMVDCLTFLPCWYEISSFDICGVLLFVENIGRSEELLSVSSVEKGVYSDELLSDVIYGSSASSSDDEDDKDDEDDDSTIRSS